MHLKYIGGLAIPCIKPNSANPPIGLQNPVYELYELFWTLGKQVQMD
jgi:hypothetical protein